MRELVLAALRQIVGSPTWKDYVRGEWWLDEDGNSTYADQDVGEAGHERVALEHFLCQHDLELIEELIKAGADEKALNECDDLLEYYMMQGISTEIGEKVYGKELWHEIKEDVRFAYAKHTNSILVIGLNFMAYKVNAKTISAIQDFILEEAGDQIGGENPDASGNYMMVEEASTKKSVELPVNDFLLLKHPGELWRSR